MISIRKLRKNKEIYKNAILKRGDEFDFENILQMDSKIREIKTLASDMRAERNVASDAIGAARKAGECADEAIIKTRKLGDNLKLKNNKLFKYYLKSFTSYDFNR